MIVNKLKLPTGGNETSLAPREVTSFAGRARTMIESVGPNNWFGPQQPLKPIAPAGTLPRAFDYQYGANLSLEPRTEQPGLVSFTQLRNLADNCDVLRSVMEHRKKQIVKVPWLFRAKALPMGVSKPSASTASNTPENDRKIKLLHDFFERPDRQHPWPTWLGMLLEEVFVIDALSIWPTYDSRGVLQALNMIDGATVKPLHDEQGWVPAPPSPAYQQYIKGMPSVNMSSGFCVICEAGRLAGVRVTTHPDGTAACNPLIYYPRNPRIHKFYGFSSVEWITRTILLALNRQTSQIYYYTFGNVPEMIIQTPETWGRDEIAMFQSYFDARSGDMTKKSTVTFIPETKGILETKDHILKDDLDEWLARVFCFPFGVNPMPFVKMMNRATSQTASQSAAEEGTVPDLNFISSLINYIVKYYFFIDDVEFVWKADVESDGLKQMRIDVGYATKGIIAVDEIRVDLGRPPVGIGNVVITNNGVLPLTPETLKQSVAALNPPQGENNGSSITNNRTKTEGSKGPSKASSEGS